MSKTSARLLAAGAALLSLTAAPTANAAAPPEAITSVYAFAGGSSPESLVSESGDLIAPHFASGYTEVHPGWDIRLSDEDYNTGLRRQDFSARIVRSGNTSVVAGTSGFVSLVDNDPYGVPFAVVALGSRSVSCATDGSPIYHGGSGNTRLWVRQWGDELYHVEDPTTADPAEVHGAAPATQANGARVRTTVKVNRISSTSQLAAYPDFAKYAGGTRTGATGHELVITQDDKTYRILVGVSAVSC